MKFHIKNQGHMTKWPPWLEIAKTYKEVQVGNDQEKSQSEKDSHSKNRGGKKTKLTIRYLYHETYRKPKDLLFQNQTAFAFETCHEASGNGALQSLYKSMTLG